jgi:hypothetical protein
MAYSTILQQQAQQLQISLPSSVVERVTSNDEVVSSILAEGITFCSYHGRSLSEDKHESTVRIVVV